jgi:hypothetical protein
LRLTLRSTLNKEINMKMKVKVGKEPKRKIKIINKDAKI